MATENDNSRSMNGILSNISRDVVDTSWDIPPLTFPKLQPTDSEEADGADETSLAEPRTIASSVPAQMEQPVSAAPTIADIPSMPLDTIDFDEAVAPADAEETATLPPLVSSTDEQDAEATQAFDTSDGITDLEAGRGRSGTRSAENHSGRTERAICGQAKDYCHCRCDCGSGGCYRRRHRGTQSYQFERTACGSGGM